MTALTMAFDDAKARAAGRLRRLEGEADDCVPRQTSPRARR